MFSRVLLRICVKFASQSAEGELEYIVFVKFLFGGL
jgi:hypothetical protein